MGRKSKEQLQKEKAAAYKVTWNKENTTRLCLRFSNTKDADVLQKLGTVPLKKEYITKLIREDMKKDN